MSYILVDDTGYLRDFASIGGLRSLREWSTGESETVRSFFEDGETTELQDLLKALEPNSNDKVINKMILELRGTLREAKGRLIISDGIVADGRTLSTLTEEDIEILGGKGSGNFGHEGRPGEQGGSAPSHGALVAKSKYGEILVVRGHSSPGVVDYQGDVRYKASRRGGETVGTFNKVDSAKQALRAPKNRDAFPSGYLSPDVEWKHLGGPGSGNFSHEGRPGEVGGSSEGGAGTPNDPDFASHTGILAPTVPEGKKKHDPETVKKALELKLQGKTLSQIQKETGLHPSTTNYYLSKMKAKEAAIAGEIAKPSLYYWKKNSETQKYEKTLTSAGKEHFKQQEVSQALNKLGVQPGQFNPISKASTPIGGEDPYEGKQTPSQFAETTKYSEPEGSVSSSTSSLTDTAEKYGYTWQVKNSGPAAGKYAWFQNGVQVSAPHAQDQKEVAAASMHYNQGPRAPVVETPAVGWPVDSNVTRAMGVTYPATVQKAYQSWADGLSGDQHQAIGSYTGSYYAHINAALRAGIVDPNTTEGKVAGRISSALDKAPKPPPPELVWRGLSGQSSKLVSGLSVGDTIEMKGFQSTSIRPEFAKSWHGSYGTADTPFLEIKPSRGAYVRSLSSHKSEYEYLLPHAAKYVVKGLAKVKIQGVGSPVHVLQLEMQ